MKITDLKPEIVWKFFHQVTQVPRPSKKEGKMIEFLESFAKQYKIAIKKDAVGNILMSKPATPGKENLPTVVLQSHMDMVCEKNNGTAHDFDHDPIETIVDGNWLCANGTTLGADNGIGVAAELATSFPAEALEAIPRLSYRKEAIPFPASPSAKYLRELFLPGKAAEFPSISVGPEPGIINTTG